jgi:oxygen-independent coproporphyrinogen-3 oxidase
LLEDLEGAGCDNVSTDLIYGLPFQNLENWLSSLTTLVKEGVKKFNIFPLMLKRSDPMFVLYQRRQDLFADAAMRLRMHHVMEILLQDMGFVRGPVFYYSRGGKHSVQQESKFNSVPLTNLMGLGVSAFGYVGDTQYYNHCDLKQYLAATASGNIPVWKGATLKGDELMRRAIILELRSQGINRLAYAEQFGCDPAIKWASAFDSLESLGLLSITEEKIEITDAGAPFTDGIARLFVSDAVRRQVNRVQQGITDRRRDLVEIHDYSPLGRG